jgi:hypothetical protein
MRRLTKKEIMMLESSLDFNQRNLPKQVSELREFIDTLVFLQDYLVKSKVKIPTFQFHIDTLISKALFHSNTIYHLLNGIEMEFKSLNFKTMILDIPSLYVLLRTLLENFLIFDFIYCQPSTRTESEFRYNNWMYCGYLSRKDTHAESETAKKMKALDLKEIERLRELIKESKYFQAFTPRQQTKLINRGDEKLLNTWVDIMAKSGFNPRISETFYKIISAYAHTSGVSIFNFSELKAGYHQNNDQANLIASLSKMIIAKYIIKFKGQVKTVEIKYNTLSIDLINKIEFNAKILNTKTTILF